MSIRWTDDPIVSGRTPIKAQHINELRTAIDRARFSYGWTLYSWTDTDSSNPDAFGASNQLPSGTPIKAKHITEIRDAIQGLWTKRSKGTVPTWSSGVTPGGPSLGTTATRVLASNVNDLRSWMNQFVDNGNKYGIHTLVQDLDSSVFAEHLNWAIRLVGSGGYVKQLFYLDRAPEVEPDEKWGIFMKLCNAAGLIPVIRLQWLPTDYRDNNTLDVLGSKPKKETDGWYGRWNEPGTVAYLFYKFVSRYCVGTFKYIEIWNEPNFGWEWRGRQDQQDDNNDSNEGPGTPDATEYGRFFMDVATAIKQHDPGIKILNGGLGPTVIPAGENHPDNNVDTIRFIKDLGNVADREGSKKFWDYVDVFASHSGYGLNHPPSYNQSRNVSDYKINAIDGYKKELHELGDFSAGDKPVIFTEAGYSRSDRDDTDYPRMKDDVITDTRPTYTKEAFRNYWVPDSQVVAICPYHLFAKVGTQDKDPKWWWILDEQDSEEASTRETPTYQVVKNLHP